MYANSLQVTQSSILSTFINPGGPTIPRSSTLKDILAPHQAVSDRWSSEFIELNHCRYLHTYHRPIAQRTTVYLEGTPIPHQQSAACQFWTFALHANLDCRNSAVYHRSTAIFVADLLQGTYFAERSSVLESILLS